MTVLYEYAEGDPHGNNARGRALNGEGGSVSVIAPDSVKE